MIDFWLCSDEFGRAIFAHLKNADPIELKFGEQSN